MAHKLLGVGATHDHQDRRFAMPRHGAGHQPCSTSVSIANQEMLNAKDI